jgi:hypothetical protein
MYAEEIDPVTEAFLGNFALISSAINLLLYETGGEAALYGVQGERTRRAADVTGIAKKITDALQTVRLRKLVFHENNERWEDLLSAQPHIMGNLRGERAR